MSASSLEQRILDRIESPSFRRAWYREHTYEDFKDSYGHVYDDAKSMRSAYREWFDETLMNVDVDIEERNGKIVVWRCLSIPHAIDEQNADQLIDFNQLGVFWSYDPEAAEAHWMQSGHQHECTVEALVAEQDVDVDGTADAWMQDSTGADEKELRLRNGAHLDVVALHEGRIYDASSMKPAVQFSEARPAVAAEESTSAVGSVVTAAGELIYRLQFVYKNFPADVAAFICRLAVAALAEYYSLNDVNDDQVTLDGINSAKELLQHRPWGKALPTFAQWVKKYGEEAKKALTGALYYSDYEDSPSDRLHVLSVLLERTKPQPSSLEEVVRLCNLSRETTVRQLSKRPPVGEPVAQLSNGWSVVQLKQQDQLLDEGRNWMANCVGKQYSEQGGTVTNMQGRPVLLYSLRDPFGIPRVNVALHVGNGLIEEAREFQNEPVSKFRAEYDLSVAEFFNAQAKNNFKLDESFSVGMDELLSWCRSGANVKSICEQDVGYDWYQFQTNDWGEPIHHFMMSPYIKYRTTDDLIDEDRDRMLHDRFPNHERDLFHYGYRDSVTGYWPLVLDVDLEKPWTKVLARDVHTALNRAHEVAAYAERYRLLVEAVQDYLRSCPGVRAIVRGDVVRIRVESGVFNLNTPYSKLDPNDDPKLFAIDTIKQFCAASGARSIIHYSEQQFDPGEVKPDPKVVSEQLAAVEKKHGIKVRRNIAQVRKQLRSEQ